MKIYRKANCKNYTKEMEDWYKKRTDRHISLVQKYCKKIVKEYPEFEELSERLEVHDDSKFEEPEYSPYVWITWNYKCKDDGKDIDDYDPPEDLDDLMNEATFHHVTENSHHPEAHSPDQNNIINRTDRDKPPEKMVDATTMPDIDIAEMAADWSAMSEEKGGTPMKWADNNVNVRWKFNKSQVDLLYGILETIWE